MRLSFTQNKKNLFVAYPWDLYMQGIYREIFTKIFSKWNIRHGSEVTLESKPESEVEMFMNRNKHLFDIFVSAIRMSDMVIADITGLNPNVMLELGVAIQLNKNVIIVTSDSLEGLPFDVSSFGVSQYKSKEELIYIIKNGLKIFEGIQTQTLDNYYESFKFNFPGEGQLKHGQLLPFPIPKYIKNLRFSFLYKFEDVSDSHDWIGMHTRSVFEGKQLSSELVYVRQNLKLESVSFPGRRTPMVGTKKSEKTTETADGYKKMEVIIYENSLKAETNDYELEDNNLIKEYPGMIVLHVWAHDMKQRDKLLVSYKEVEILSLDTKAPLEILS